MYRRQICNLDAQGRSGQPLGRPRLTFPTKVLRLTWTTLRTRWFSGQNASNMHALQFTWSKHRRFLVKVKYSAQWLHVNSNRMTSTPQTLCTIWWMMKSQDLETRVGIICSFLLASWKLEASQAPTCAPCNFARPFLQLQSSEISSPNIRNIIDEEKYSTQGLVSDQTLKKQEQRNSPLHHPQWGLEASKMIFAYVDIC